MTAAHPRAWDQTATGRALDFAAPVVAPANLYDEIAHGLAQINRYSGGTPAPYSVAQHSVLMARAAAAETGDPLLAAYCLLHDGHEAYLGDTPQPAKQAVEDECFAAIRENGMSELVADSLVARWRGLRRRVEARLDDAIHEAAGLPPIDDRHRALVKTYDIRALRTERRDLLRTPPRAWDAAIEAAPPLPVQGGAIRPWPAGVAYERFAQDLTRYCPAAAAATGRDSQPEGDAA